eukprot:gnl/TRDRNA2_/TRDRNA2_140935_c0_seq2.p1 gnl/TRDRNA2_/TRDRNA2_140935_c0~~gnl/TRDRNA2_/TRDRNA2_140935_c0_seq2.p1  ORF type:complete len:290 (-),score=17.57 gnl/TRDRNA2_/TRDRNA2_140935_c0_seq2:43-831(-)
MMNIVVARGVAEKVGWMLLVMMSAGDALRLRDRTDDQRVKLTLAYETYCPDSQAFILGDLRQVWNTEGFPEILDIDMLPYGNAEGTGLKTICQHGSQECKTNMVHDCAIKHMTTPIKFILCAQQYTKNMWRPLEEMLENIMAACAKWQEREKVTVMMQCCFQSDNKDVEQRTSALNHHYVPWVLLNGKHSLAAERYLRAAICSAYKELNCGTLGIEACRRKAPAACSTLSIDIVRKTANTTRPGACPRFEYGLPYEPGSSSS